MGGQLGVSVGHGLKLLLDELFVKWVKVDSLSETGHLGDTGASANNAGWHDDVVEDSLVNSLESAASGALLAGVANLSLGVDGPVDDDNDRPLELVLQVIDHLTLDFLVELEGAVGDLDQDVLALAAIVLLEGDLLDGVDEHHAQVPLDVLVRVLEGSQRLGGVLLQLGWLNL